MNKSAQAVQHTKQKEDTTMGMDYDIPRRTKSKSSGWSWTLRETAHKTPKRNKKRLPKRMSAPMPRKAVAREALLAILATTMV